MPSNGSAAISNSFGCILCRVSDVVLGSQYVYYTRIKSETYYVLLSPSAATPTSSNSSRTLSTLSRRRSNVLLSLAALVALAGASSPLVAEESVYMGLRRWFKFDDREFVGRVFAWACTTMYLSSRLPQIYKNFVRQSTSGLAIMLFISAFLGNTFYTLSILTSGESMDSVGGRESERSTFLLEELPYLLGSAGTVGFDITIFIQWIHYGEGKIWFHRRWYGDKAWDIGEVVDGQSLVDEETYSTASSSTGSSKRSEELENIENLEYRHAEMVSERVRRD